MLELVKDLRMTSDEAPLPALNLIQRRRGGGMKYASQALPRRRLIFPTLALGGLLILSGCATSAYKVHVSKGNDYLKEMNYPASEREFREAHRLNPKDAEMHCEFGNALEFQGKYEEAEKEYREAPQLKPGDAAILRALAYFLDRQGRRKEARSFWEKALKVEKDPINRGMIQKRLAEPR